MMSLHGCQYGVYIRFFVGTDLFIWNIRYKRFKALFAFVKECFHNAVEIDILGIFEVYSSLQIWPPPPKKIFFRGEIIQGEWHNFHWARALFLTGVKFHVLPCVLVCFLVEFDLLFTFSVLSCRILDCASVFIYVYEHDRLCFPMSTEETAVFDCICWLSSDRKGQSNTVWNRWKSTLSAQSIRVNLNHGKEM